MWDWLYSIFDVLYSVVRLDFEWLCLSLRCVDLSEDNFVSGIFFADCVRSYLW